MTPLLYKSLTAGLALLLAGAPSLADTALAKAVPVADSVAQQTLKTTQAWIDTHRSGQHQEAQSSFRRGLQLANEGKRDAAIKVFAALTREYPAWPEPFNNLAVLYAEQGDYTKAQETLLAALDTHPSYATAHKNLRDVYEQMASLAYHRAFELNKNNPSPTLKLALIRDLPERGVAAPAPSAPLATDTAAAIIEPTRTATPAPAPRSVAEPAPTATVAAVPVTRPAQQATSPTSKAAAMTAAIAAVQGWARAWTNQDVDGYLDYYTADFRPDSGVPRSTWEQQRRERLRGPRFIEVVVEQPRAEFVSPTEMEVTFVQRYRSDKFAATARKRLTLTRAGTLWRIRAERVLR